MNSYYLQARGQLGFQNKIDILQQLLARHNSIQPTTAAVQSPSSSSRSSPIVPYGFWRYVASLMTSLKGWNSESMSFIDTSISSAGIEGLRINQIKELLALFRIVGTNFLTLSEQNRYEDWQRRLQMRMFSDRAVRLYALIKPTDIERDSYHNTRMMDDVVGCMSKILSFQGTPSSSASEILRRNSMGCELVVASNRG